MTLTHFESVLKSKKQKTKKKKKHHHQQHYFSHKSKYS